MRLECIWEWKEGNLVVEICTRKDEERDKSDLNLWKAFIANKFFMNHKSTLDTLGLNWDVPENIR